MGSTPHGGARTMGLGPDVVDFSASINPLGMHPAVRKVLAGSLDDAVEYPDANAVRLEEALAAYAGTDPEMVVAGNGATEIIHNLCRRLAGSPVVVPAPTFGEYAAAARLCGSRVKSFRTMDMAADTVAFAEAIPKDGCAFVCNPANPSGRLIPGQAITEMAKAAADASAVIVVDECFIEMTPGRNESVAGRASRHPNMVVLRSMTKSFGLAGLRAGYCIANPAISDALRSLRAPWSVNALAQAAGIEALKHPGHIRDALEVVSRETPYLRGAMLEAGGMHPYDTDTNYILAKVQGRSADIQRRLLRQGVLVRDCADFEGLGDNHIRVSVRTRWENTILADAIAESCRV